MAYLQDSLLVTAGVGAGLTASIAGLASLVSYPALLLAGLSPVSANVSNTVAIVFGSIGSASGSRPELRGQRRHIVILSILSVLGGCCGGALVLLTPASTFQHVVPVLIALASLTILLVRRPRPRPAGHDRPSLLMMAGVFAIGVYGGYFGAAAGVLLLALLLATSSEPFPRSNAVKNVVSGLANGASAVIFVFDTDIAWRAVLFLGAGLLLGGRIGPAVVRVCPVQPLRFAIAVAGLALAGYLAFKN